ncbi:hypothetical protein LguiB_034095 [Lonicera macranthoides]
MFRGQINLSTTSASKIYFNLDIPEVTEFMQMYDGNVNRKINAASEPIKHMTIVEILSLHSDSDSEEVVLICKAEITSIDTHKGWYYDSCQQCCKKVTKLESSYICENCKTNEVLPIPRYKLHVQVQDETGKTTFVMFHREAEKILEFPNSQIFNSENINLEDRGLPIVLNKIVGKTFLFHFKLNRFNLRLCYENYTVTKIQTPLTSSSDTNYKQVKNEAEGPQKTIEDVESPTKAAEQAGMSSTSKRKESSPIKPLHNKKMKKTNLRMD